MTNSPPPLDTESLKQLTNSLFLIHGAHKNLEKERERLTSSVTQISYLSEAFGKYAQEISEKIKTFDESIEKALSKTIKECGKDIAAQATLSFIGQSSSQIETSLKKINESSSRFERELELASKNINFFSKWFISVAIGGAIIGGLIVGALFRYLPPPSLDAEIKKRIDTAEYFLRDMWLKVNQKEKDRANAMKNKK